MKPIQIYIGYDNREIIAFHVLSHSILSRANNRIAIIPLVRGQLPEYTRIRGPLETTDFSMTRFLVPYLSGYSGYSIFLDCDMLCKVDIAEIMVEVIRTPNKAVWVCKHDYTPKGETKFLGQTQTKYERKNWSSVMLFDNERCRALTPDYVNLAQPLELHRFKWINDDEIGSLPLEWNWLVGEYGHNEAANILHYTQGTP